MKRKSRILRPFRVLMSSITPSYTFWHSCALPLFVRSPQVDYEAGLDIWDNYLQIGPFIWAWYSKRNVK